MDYSRSRNLTLRLDESLYRSIKVIAAKRDTSISALVTQKLVDVVNEESDFADARAVALGYLEQGLDLGTGGHIGWTRDELHER